MEDNKPASFINRDHKFHGLIQRFSMINSVRIIRCIMHHALGGNCPIVEAPQALFNLKVKISIVHHFAMLNRNVFVGGLLHDGYNMQAVK